MNILVDIRCLMDANYTGVGEYAYKLLDNLFKIDQTNQYFLFYNNWGLVQLPDWRYDNVKFVKYKWPNKLFNASLKFLNEPYLSGLVKESIDIVFVPNLNFVSFAPSDKVVLTMHDISFDLFPEVFSWKRRLWHKVINPKKLCQRANHVITVSEHTKNDVVQQYNISPHKITATPLGIDPVYTKINDDFKLQSIKRKYELPDEFIFTLSTIEPRKNITGLIDMYNLWREKYQQNIPLIIAGGKGWLYQPIFKHQQTSPYKDDIRFLSYVDQDDKAALYNLASLFIYPSFYEGFGFPPLEAIASGCPVVCSYTGSLAEVVGTRAELIDPYNVAEGAQAIDIALNKPRPIVNNVLETYSWKKTAEQTLEVFEKML